ncbi:MAG TPA: AMP-binding protein [Actinomycetota bacterium]
MRNLGVGSWMERWGRIVPDRIAVISGERSWTYGQEAGRVRRLAQGLRSLGIGSGDRVGWLGPNHPAFLEVLFATGSLGAVMVPLNHRLEQPAILRAIDDSGTAILVVEGSVTAVPMGATVRTLVVVGGLEATAAEHGALWIDYETLLERSGDDPVDVEVSLDDLCMLPYTSGTTGQSKGVMLTHGNVTWNVVNFLSCADFRSDDVTIAIAPFFRVGGTGVNVLPVVFKGGTVIVPTEVSPDEILRLSEKHQVTVGFGNPDLLEALVHSSLWLTADLSSIRFIMTGGAPVPERLIRAYLDRGVTLLQGYGLSEAAPLVLLLDPASALRKVGSAGKPPLLVDIRIVDPDGSDVGSGETGELVLRGPNVMAGYWNLAEATSQAIDQDGWLRTGEAARMDDEGYVWIVDRVQDRYVWKGQTVFPGNVERVLMTHPAVIEAGVVGVPQDRDGDAGHVGAAFVVLAADGLATEEELLVHCGEHLGEHEVPASIAFVERLPRNSVGKLLRHELLAAARAQKA